MADCEGRLCELQYDETELWGGAYSLLTEESCNYKKHFYNLVCVYQNPLVVKVVRISFLTNILITDSCNHI